MATQVAQSIPTKRLAAAILSTDASFTVNNILDWGGVALTSADFGTRAFGCFRNAANTQIEFFEFDPATIASSAITILARGLDYKGGSTDAIETKYTWPANSTLVELGGNMPALFEQYIDKTADETIAGIKTFSSFPITPSSAPTTDYQVANKAYADGLAIAGAPDGADAVKGIYERATIAEIEAGTASGSTTAPLAVVSGRLGARLYTAYAADAGANDTYAITCAPIPTAYTAGMVITFKANTVNTGACTVNVNTLGAKSLKVNGSLDPQDGYIKAGQIVTAIYDGTNFQIQSVSGKPSVSQSGEEIYAADAGANDTYAITVAPVPAAYVTGQVFRFKANTVNTGAATLNVNSLGAISILRADGSALADGDIAANQFVEVIYNGASFLMLSPVANSPKYTQGTTTYDMTTASGTVNIAHGLGRTPRKVRLTGTVNIGSDGFAQGILVGGTGTNAGIYQGRNNATDIRGTGTTFKLISAVTSADQTAVVTYDATNIILTWTKTNSPTETANIIWEAEA